MDLLFDINKADKTLAEADPAMAGVIARYGPCGMAVQDISSTFASLLRSIVFQQLSTASANAIYSRVVALFDEKEPFPERIPILDDESLRGAGLSKQKIAYLRDLADKTLKGIVPPLDVLIDLPDAEILKRLTQVHGIGRWTVEMLLMFSLGRPDVLPATDLALQKGFQQIYETPDLPKPRAIEQFGERWRPYRTVASWYLWRVIDGDNPAW